MLTLPSMAASMLLKSWAIPPASTPTDLSFSIFMSSSCIFLFSVTSLKTNTTPKILPDWSLIGAPLSAMARLVPSLEIKMV